MQVICGRDESLYSKPFFDYIFVCLVLYIFIFDMLLIPLGSEITITFVYIGQVSSINSPQVMANNIFRRLT